MPSYKVNPLIPLSEFGSTASELNDSFLVGIQVNFSRPVQFEDYEIMGLAYSFEMLEQANKVSVEFDDEGNPTVMFSGPVSMGATGTVDEFFENGVGLYVRFVEWLKTPSGEVTSNCWQLTDETRVLLTEEAS